MIDSNGQPPRPGGPQLKKAVQKSLGSPAPSPRHAGKTRAEVIADYATQRAMDGNDRMVMALLRFEASPGSGGGAAERFIVKTLRGARMDDL